MIIAIRIPHFWIVVEELRCPELHDRPIIIGEGFLEKTGGQARVLASNHLAAEFGVKPGVSLAHARQLCPEAVFISPDMPVYAGVWGEVMALLLTYTPVVQSVTPGEALCDVTGCERLFGDPLTLAGDLVRHIQGSLSLPAFAGVATNRLVAQLAARDTTAPTRFIPSGHEAAFLAPLPITVLPDLDAQLLLDFQVLGVKTVEHLSRISERAMAKRFGPVGARLARYARGVDDRPVQPDPRLPSVAVSRRTDDDLFDGLDVDGVARHLVQLLAGDLVAALHEQRLAGRLLRLVIREPRDEPRLPNARAPELSPEFPRGVRALPTADETEQVFPNQDSRIHSMLPQPKQPGRTRYLDPLPSGGTGQISDGASPEYALSPVPESDGMIPQAGIAVRAVVRLATGRPVNDLPTMVEFVQRLLSRAIAQLGSAHRLLRPGVELLLEMSQFTPPEQLTLAGLDGRPVDGRLAKVERQEKVMTARFGATPFRHMEALNLESVLSEKVFRWGDGLK